MADLTMLFRSCGLHPSDLTWSEANNELIHYCENLNIVPDISKKDYQRTIVPVIYEKWTKHEGISVYMNCLRMFFWNMYIVYGFDRTKFEGICLLDYETELAVCYDGDKNFLKEKFKSYFTHTIPLVLEELIKNGLTFYRKEEYFSFLEKFKQGPAIEAEAVLLESSNHDVQPLRSSSNMNLDDGPVVEQIQTTARECEIQCTLLEPPKVINKLDAEAQCSLLEPSKVINKLDSCAQCEVVLSSDVQLQCFLLVPPKDILKLDAGNQCDVAMAQNDALDLNGQSGSSLVEKMDVDQQCSDELQIHDSHFEFDSEFIEPYQVTSTTANDTVCSVADPVDENFLEHYIRDVSYHHVYKHKGVEFKYIMVEISTKRAITFHEKKQIINKYISIGKSKNTNIFSCTLCNGTCKFINLKSREKSRLDTHLQANLIDIFCLLCKGKIASRSCIPAHITRWHK